MVMNTFFVGVDSLQGIDRGLANIGRQRALVDHHPRAAQEYRMVNPPLGQIDRFQAYHPIGRGDVQRAEFQVDLVHRGSGLLEAVSKFLQVARLGGSEVRVLHLHMMDAVAFGDHLGKVQDLECSLRIARMRGALDHRIETEAHDRDATQLGLIGALPPHTASAGSDGRAYKKLST
jgi:hypothetical protein